jgi:hypothetical protein
MKNLNAALVEGVAAHQSPPSSFRYEAIDRRADAETIPVDAFRLEEIAEHSRRTHARAAEMLSPLHVAVFCFIGALIAGRLSFLPSADRLLCVPFEESESINVDQIPFF